MKATAWTSLRASACIGSLRRKSPETETVADLIDHAFSSYNAGRLREVCRVFTHKFLEPDCTVGLTLSGALTPAGLGMSCLIPLIKSGFVDWIVSTGANLYHDTHFALDLPLHQSRPNLDDLRASPERRHPDLRHRLRLQDLARYRLFLSRADPERRICPADGNRRVPSPGRAIPPRPGSGAGPAVPEPSGRGLSRPTCRSTRRAPETVRSA